MARRPLAFLNDRAAFVRRFVLAEILGPPRGRLLRGPPRPPVPPPASPTSPARAK
jgi:hypothetical protein